MKNKSKSYWDCYEQVDKVRYIDSNGELILEVNLKEITEWIQDNELNIKDTSYCKSGSGMVCDPNNVEVERFEEIPVGVYLDDNWYSVTENYFNSLGI